MPSPFSISRKGVIALYNKVVGGIEEGAASDIERAYGGVIRAGKGNSLRRSQSG